jgi:PAS domain S-box-containing protein
VTNPDSLPAQEGVGPLDADLSGEFKSIALIALLTFAGYYVGSELASFLRIPSTRSSIFWIPNAVLLTVLLWTPPRYWSLWLLAALPAHILTQTKHDDATAFIVLAPFVPNIVQATLSALALRYFDAARPRFESLRETAVFVLIAVLLVPGLVSLAAGWFFVRVGWEADVWLVARGRFLNNVTTGLTIAPLLLIAVASVQGRGLSWKFERRLEFFALVSLLILSLLAVHHWTPETAYAFPVQLYMPLPFLLWAAVRFSIGGLALSLLVVAVLAIAETIAGRGPYAGPSPAEEVLTLQLALAELAVPLIFLSSAIAERQRKDTALRQSEERYRSVVDDQTELVCRYLPDGKLTFVNVAYARYFDRPTNELIGTSFLAIIPEPQQPLAKLQLSAMVEKPEIRALEHQVVAPTGELRWQHWIDRPIVDRYGRVIEFQGVGRDITEQKRAESRLQLQYMVTRIQSEAESMAEAAPKILQAVCDILGWDVGEIWRLSNDGQRLMFEFAWHLPEAELSSFADASRNLEFSPGAGLPGQAWQSRKPVWITEVAQESNFKRTALAAAAGLHSALAVPILAGDQAIFVLGFFSRRVWPRDADLLDTMVNIADQIGLFIRRKTAESLVRENERLLRLKDEQLRRTERLASTMVTHTGLDGRWMRVPPKFCELLGYTEAELIGRRFHEFTHPDDIETDWSQCQRLIRGEISSFDLEKRYFRRDGKIVWVAINVSVVTDAAGHPVQFLSYIRDVSRRRQAEEELRKSEAKFAGIIDIAAEAIVSIDESRNVTLFNEGAEKIFGYSKKEIIGQRFDILLPKEFRHVDAIGLGELAEGQSSSFRTGARREIFGLRKDGRQFPAEASISRLELDGHEIFTVLLRDVSERHAAEQALLQSDTRLRLAMEAARIGYWEIDRRTGEIHRTESLERIFGYTPGTMPTTLEAFFALVYPDDIEHVREAGVNSMDRDIEFRIIGRDDTVRWISSRTQAISQSDGRESRLIGILFDITERKQAEIALRDALAEVERLRSRAEAENIYLRREVSETHRAGEIVGQSEKVRKIIKQVEQVALTDVSVLVLGETGTGKELVARAVHALSARRNRPLVKVNCAALPESLIESELFGHEKGAFTGASARQLGRFEIADGGTIFLDEIGDLPLGLQVKLLRVLQEGEFERIGSGRTIKSNVRVIAATNRDLMEAMQAGSFRSDLYYRLAVYPILVPPLRERKEDIPLLAERFLVEARQRLGRTFAGIPRKVLDALQSYDWPGNVRELQNVIERAAVISGASGLQLPEEWMQASAPRKTRDPYTEESPDPPTDIRDATLEDLERAHILRILKETRWRIEGPKGAAVILGLNPSTLRSRMSKLRILRSL